RLLITSKAGLIVVDGMIHDTPPLWNNSASSHGSDQTRMARIGSQVFLGVGALRDRTVNIFCEPVRQMPVLLGMDTTLLNTKFARIGARLKMTERPTRRSQMRGLIALDVQADRQGEFFEIVQPPQAQAELLVLDVQPQDRHLLLLVRDRGEKSKFLCGHDERHWFVAGIPETAPVGTVRQAKEALKPAEVQHAQASLGLRATAQNRRKNAAFVRQGEWFFLPVKDLVVEEKHILRNEPLSRGNGSKSHWIEFCYRTGGEVVHVCKFHPAGLTELQYQQLVSRNPKSRNWSWHIMRRNAGVFARGRIRHADHATILLHCWHQVLMNTEGRSKAMQHVAFLD
ncbi:MAG: hypothetical protein ACRCZF_16425, partial [Gemmataceae bacterium]